MDKTHKDNLPRLIDNNQDRDLIKRYEDGIDIAINTVNWVETGLKIAKDVIKWVNNKQKAYRKSEQKGIFVTYEIALSIFPLKQKEENVSPLFIRLTF